MSLGVVVENSFKAVRTFRAGTYDKKREIAQSFTGFLGYPMNRSSVLHSRTENLIKPLTPLFHVAFAQFRLFLEELKNLVRDSASFFRCVVWGEHRNESQTLYSPRFRNLKPEIVLKVIVLVGKELVLRN